MENQESEQERYKRAKARVNELREFYNHLWAYAGVNVMLFIINWITAPGAWWFYWVTVFWGIGILWHAIGTFGTSKLTGKAWEEKKIKEIMDKEKQSE